MQSSTDEARLEEMQKKHVEKEDRQFRSREPVDGTIYDGLKEKLIDGQILRLYRWWIWKYKLGLEIILPKEYPLISPSVRLLNGWDEPVEHPNVNARNGHLDMELIRNENPRDICINVMRLLSQWNLKTYAVPMSIECREYNRRIKLSDDEYELILYEQGSLGFLKRMRKDAGYEFGYKLFQGKERGGIREPSYLVISSYTKANLPLVEREIRAFLSDKLGLSRGASVGSAACTSGNDDAELSSDMAVACAGNSGATASAKAKVTIDSDGSTSGSVYDGAMVAKASSDLFTKGFGSASTSGSDCAKLSADYVGDNVASAFVKANVTIRPNDFKKMPLLSPYNREAQSNFVNSRPSDTGNLITALGGNNFDEAFAKAMGTNTDTIFMKMPLLSPYRRHPQPGMVTSRVSDIAKSSSLLSQAFSDMGIASDRNGGSSTSTKASVAIDSSVSGRNDLRTAFTGNNDATSFSKFDDDMDGTNIAITKLPAKSPFRASPQPGSRRLTVLDVIECLTAMKDELFLSNDIRMAIINEELDRFSTRIDTLEKMKDILVTEYQTTKESRRAKTMCEMCLTRRKDTVFTCGHRYCETCAQRLRNDQCSECGELVTDYVRLFES